MRRLALLFFIHLLPACCSGGPDLFQIWITTQPSAESKECNWEGPMWNGTTSVVSGTNALVLWDGDPIEGRRPVEVFDNLGARMSVPQETSLDAACDNGCPSERTLYRLPSSPGDYTLVHRASQGNGETVWLPHGGDPWTTWDEERALVTTLHVTAP